MELLNETLQSLAYVALGVLIYFIAKFVKDFITPFDDNKELAGKDNPALGLSASGYYLGVIIIYMGAALGPSLAPGAFETDGEFWGAIGKQLLMTGVWALVGIGALNAARVILDKVNLRNFSVEDEIIRDRNVGAGAVEFGSYIASALIISAAIYGDSGGWLTALAFFVIGQITLILFTKFYQVLTPFDVNKEIEEDNVAAGVALCGNFIAMGLVVAAAASVPFTGWAENIADFGIHVGIGLVFVVIARFIADKILLPSTSLNKEIATDKNVGAALIEATSVISFAALIFALV